MNDNIKYEIFTQEIYNEILKNLYVKNIEVKHNVKLTGKSGQKHQIDVYWEYQYDNTTFKIAIECKNYNHTVSIGKVRDFFGVLYDLEEVKGIMVTKKGYQEGAKKFGEHYGIDLMELREPEEGEAIVAETTLTIGSSVRHRLFLVDEDWAKAHDLNIQSYNKRLDWLCSPVCGKWINATHGDWLDTKEMESPWNEDEEDERLVGIVRNIKASMDNWEDHATGLFALNRISIFAASDNGYEMICLIWFDGTEEPELWVYDCNGES